MSLMRLSRRWFQVGAALCVAGAAAGVWALLHPAAFWLKPWRPEPQRLSRYVFGPYPVEADFQALQQQGVTTVISLLDSDLPYEKVLLGQETELAARYGMKVMNFPMASILGQSFGKDYVANSRAAADAALAARGVVYIHCYLGLHRADAVRKFLDTTAGTASYQGAVPSERSPDTLALDRANLALMQGRPEDTLRELAAIKAPTTEAKLLGGWANFRVGRIEPARALFAEAAQARPDLADAAAGLGYCALRGGDLPEAERQFQRVLSLDPADVAGSEGLGYVRYRQGRRDEAQVLFEKVLEKRPDNAEVRELLAKLKGAGS